MDIYGVYRSLTIKIILALSLISDITAYVLNKEICLKLQYNLDRDMENSLERYHFCQELSQTLDGVEQVIYKMQIKDQMADAWLQLVKKRGVDNALNKLNSAKLKEMVTEDAAIRWQDLIKNHGKSFLEDATQNILPTLKTNPKQHDGQMLMIGETSWVPYLLIGGALFYIILGLLLMIGHHIRTKKCHEDEGQFLCDDISPTINK